MSNGMRSCAQGARGVARSNGLFVGLVTRNFELLKRVLLPATGFTLRISILGWLVIGAIQSHAGTLSIAVEEGYRHFSTPLTSDPAEAGRMACGYLKLGFLSSVATSNIINGHPRYSVSCVRSDGYAFYYLTYVDWTKLCPYPFSGYPSSDVCTLSDNVFIPVKNQGPPGACVGNPINSGSGNKFQIETDYQQSSFALALLRIYNGNPQVVSDPIFGAQWRHSYQRSVRLNSNASISTAYVSRDNGRVYFFTLSGSTWLPDANVTDLLEQLHDGSGNLTGWRYTVASDDSVETYSADGKLQSIADRSGRIQALIYSDGTNGPNGGYVLDASGNPTAKVLPAGLLLRVTDDTGRQLDFGYDFYSRIIRLTEPSGDVITYGYDANSNLVSAQYPDGRSKTYLYENTSFPHALTGIVDENGDRYATYRYDSQGRADDEDHGGSVDHYNLAYTTGAYGNPVSTVVTDPVNTQRTYNFTTVLGVVKSTGVSQPGGSGCSAASSAITYDANGNVASRADFNGHQTCYAYDLTRNLETERVEGLASGASCPSDLATYTPAPNTAERKILTQWDSRFRLPTKITEAGRETSLVYDDHGNVTSRSVKDLASGQTRTWTTSYTYHATVPGVLVQTVEDGPRLDVADLTTTDYYAPDENCVGDPMGCRGQVKQVTNALGHITHVDEYDANGRVLRTTDPNGLVTTFSYSPRGWLTSRSVGTETTGFDYDYVGQLTKLTRPDGSYVSFEYDPAHRLTTIVDQDGNRLTYTLDAMGNRTHEAITSPDGATVYYTHSRTFDTLGRLWQDIGAYNQIITYQYDAQGNMKQVDGARTDVTDVTSHSYDALDRLTQTLNADGGVVQVKTNALDQTTQVVDPANQATTETVDAFGDVTQTQSADTGTTTRTYDEAGNLKTETDARNVTVSYTYDALNRLTQKQSSQSGTPGYQYLYDTCQNGKGRLCSTQRDGSLDEYFNYDTLGRLAYRYSFGVVTATTGYAWRPGGQLLTLTYPTSRTVTYSYDVDGRISQVTTAIGGNNPVVLARNFSYNYPFAGQLSFQYGNGLTAQLSLDADYRPTHRLDGPYDIQYSHDPASDIGQLTQGTFQTTYAYDASGRLVSALDNDPSSFGSLAWTYDLNGNRQSETRNAGSMPYVYSPPNWLYQKGAETRPRTANGNAQSTSTASFSYGGYNRLVTSQTAAETTTYTYNALGERIKKLNQNGLATVFHYGPDGELLYERNQQGKTKEYVWLNGRLLARIDNSTTIYYYHVDHLGTPQAMTNASGTVVWKADYEPFGKATVTVSTIENNVRLPGQYYDRETVLHYNYFRDYDPTTGRYIEADPLGIDGGLNVYGYANQNPLLFTDPTGLFVPLIIPGICAGGGCEAVIGAAIILMSPPGQKAVRDTLNKAGESCPPGDKDPCKGLRNQLHDHERKLRQYMANPMSMDNRGFLAGALDKNDQALYNTIYMTRLVSLQKQIANFKKQLEECERRNGH